MILISRNAWMNTVRARCDYGHDILVDAVEWDVCQGRVHCRSCQLEARQRARAGFAQEETLRIEGQAE